jgi:hypothetical protein
LGGVVGGKVYLPISEVVSTRMSKDTRHVQFWCYKISKIVTLIAQMKT